jgi:hypothetical protein
MKYIFILILIALIKSEVNLNEEIIKIKQSISKKIKDMPNRIETLIKNLGGNTKIYKSTIKWKELKNFLIPKGLSMAAYANCVEASFNGKSYYEKSDFISGANNQYTLNYYITNCYKVDENLVSFIAIIGKYSGIIQNITYTKQIDLCVKLRKKNPGWARRLGNKCYKQQVATRGLNNQEWHKVNEGLKIKFNQDTLDKLNYV